MCIHDIIKDHFNYKFIEKKLFHEYEYESEYGSNAFELVLRMWMVIPLARSIPFLWAHCHGKCPRSVMNLYSTQ